MSSTDELEIINVEVLIGINNIKRNRIMSSAIIHDHHEGVSIINSRRGRMSFSIC